ncbi:MAG: L-fucose:H+ symporter permease [Prevotella sp.]|nr:L-fucose:H+ symporter permease [Prevotella sp.]
METTKNGLFYKNGISFLVPFIVITLCFALWGFANDVTNPMVKAFSKIFRMSVTEGALVQVAFYGGYFLMAFPAAMFIQKYSYKAGVLMGLSLYAIGALMFFPAKATGLYYPFLFAYLILTCGLSFLETSCNPYIYIMGSEDTATRRLNLAQAFNPIGSLCGMYVAMNFVQAKLNPMDTATRARLSDAEFETLRNQDLSILIQPYIYIGLVIIAIALLIRFTKMPKNGETSAEDKMNEHKSLFIALKEIIAIKNYREGVIAQFFYVGAQITCWTFIIQYGTRVLMNEGLTEKAAEVMSQRYNIYAMICFVCSRFICTWFLKYVKPGRLLLILACMALFLVCGVIFFTDIRGLYCLVGVSACMSLMFPTIYGIALNGLGENVKFGGAGLIMAILGGSVLPPAQAAIIDIGHQICGLPAENASFIIPLICFIFVALYGLRSHKRHLA